MASVAERKALSVRTGGPAFKGEPPSPMSHAGILARHAYRQDLPPAVSKEKLPPLEGEEKAVTLEKAVSPRRSKKGERKFSLGKFGLFGGGSKQTLEQRKQDPPPPPATKPQASYQVSPSRTPAASPLLAPRPDGKPTLVLDLDETLVRSSFDMTFEFDFEAPFALNGVWCTARVRKRPHVDTFLNRVAKHFELIVMTAGVEPYASLVLDILDSNRLLEHRFYRDSCTKTDAGLLVKDLARMNRPMHKIIIVDNSPNAYLWHPNNAIDIRDFVGDQRDTDLLTVADFLDVIKDADDFRPHLHHWKRGKAYALNNNDDT